MQTLENKQLHLLSDVCGKSMTPEKEKVPFRPQPDLTVSDTETELVTEVCVVLEPALAQTLAVFQCFTLRSYPFQQRNNLRNLS